MEYQGYLDIYDQANIGVMNSLFAQQNVNNAFTMADAMDGVEISGGHHYGGYWYSLAVVNQNTTGITNDSSLVPSATGGNQRQTWVLLRFQFQGYLRTLHVPIQSRARQGKP